MCALPQGLEAAATAAAGSNVKKTTKKWSFDLLRMEEGCAKLCKVQRQLAIGG